MKYLFVALLALTTIPAFAVVNPPRSYIDYLSPPNMTNFASDPAGAINQMTTGFVAPLADAMGIWFLPMFSVGIFVAFYAHTENLIYSGMFALPLVLGNLALFPTQVGILISAFFIIGYAMAIYLGVRFK